MNVKTIWIPLKGFLKRHAPKILAGVAIGAEALGFYCMHKEAPIVRERLDNLPEDAKFVDKVKVAGPVYLPAIAMFIISTGGIVGTVAAGESKAAVLASLLSASEGRLRMFENKVVSELGPEKAQEMHEKAAEELAEKNRPAKNDIILTGKGNVLFYEVMTGQWFRSSLAAVKNDAADFNTYVQSKCWAEFDEWLHTLSPKMEAGFAQFFGFNLDHKLILKIGDSHKFDDGELYHILDYVERPIMWNGKKPMEFHNCENCYIE